MTVYKYFNRDISWLSFNHRVLEEASDPSLPLYERIRFLAIYSNNLEEFYQVRVSYYRQLLRNAELIPAKIEDVQPVKVLHQITEIVNGYLAHFNEIFDNQIIPELRKSGIILLDKNSVLTEDQSKEIKEIFMTEILSVLQPVLLLKKRIRPFLKTGQGYIVTEMVVNEPKKNPESKTRVRYGLIKVPTDHNISRFIELHSVEGEHFFMFLEDVIMRHSNKIFPGYTINEWFTIKLTRDADLEYDEFEEEELINAIGKISSSRTLGKPNRFLYDKRMSNKFLSYLMQTFKIESEIVVQGSTYHNFQDFFGFPNPLSPQFEYEKLVPLRIPELESYNLISDAIEQKDYLLSVPYQSYDYFLKFLEQAARDESVTEIKATQYRVADRSAVVNALMNAAENGKKVTVFVELKARFDEEANLQYAAEMIKAGIHIIYSIPGLKVHAKLALVIRDKAKYPELRDQAYLSTGNFNEKTARLYCDQGLFTSHKGIISDLKKMFLFLEEQEQNIRFEHILVPNFNLVYKIGKLIGREIENVTKGKPGYILLKMNGLQDTHMVDMLYRASEAGVKIDLIIRGICIVKPGKKFSKNIRVVRIVDRYLEHSRVYVFHNDGHPKVYLGSADWMKRNLNARVECVFPIYEESLKHEIIDILQIQLSDNVKACEIGLHGENVKIKNDRPPVQSQLATYDYFRNKYPRI